MLFADFWGSLFRRRPDLTPRPHEHSVMTRDVRDSDGYSVDLCTCGAQRVKPNDSLPWGQWVIECSPSPSSSHPPPEPTSPTG